MPVFPLREDYCRRPEPPPFAPVRLTVGPGQCTLDERGELGAALGVIAGLAEFGHRLRQLPLVTQGVAEVVVGLGEVGFDPDRLTVCGDRLFQLPLALRAVPRL